MFNEAQLSLSGYVATQPRFRTTGSGRSQTTMRVAWTPRWVDRATGEWANGQTSFITVICWRKLADNAATCIHKGDPVVVRGRLSIRPYDDKDGVPRLAVEVDAVTLGHDLSRGVANFQRTRPGTGETAAEQFSAAQADQDGASFGDGGGFGDGAGFGDGLPGDEPATSGAAGAGIFDEGAIAALEPEADAVAAPF